MNNVQKRDSLMDEGEEHILNDERLATGTATGRLIRNDKFSQVITNVDDVTNEKRHYTYTVL